MKQQVQKQAGAPSKAPSPSRSQQSNAVVPQRRSAPQASQAQPLTASASPRLAQPLSTGFSLGNVPIMPPQKNASGTMAIAASGISGRSEPLPFRGEMEHAFGFSFADVRVHADEAAARANDRLSADAYTFGNDIAFARSAPPRELVGHELTHVVQQRAGAGPAGGVGQEGDRFEREADAAATALRRGAPIGLSRAYPSATRSPAVQRRAVQLDATQGPLTPGVATTVIKAIIDIIDANDISGDVTDIGPISLDDRREVPEEHQRLLSLWIGALARRRVLLLQGDAELAGALPTIRVADALAATTPLLDALDPADAYARSLRGELNARIPALSNDAPPARQIPRGTPKQISDAQTAKATENAEDQAVKTVAESVNVRNTADKLEPTITGADGVSRPAGILRPEPTQRTLEQGISERLKPGEAGEDILRKEAARSPKKFQGTSGLVRLGKNALSSLGILDGAEGIILAFDNKQFRPIQATPAPGKEKDYARSQLNELAPRFRLRYKKSPSDTDYVDRDIKFQTPARYKTEDGKDRAPLPHDIEAIQTFTDASSAPDDTGLSADGVVEAIVTQSSGYRFRVRFDKPGGGGGGDIIATHVHPDQELAEAAAVVSSTDTPTLPNVNLTKDFGVVGPEVTAKPRIAVTKATEPLVKTEYEANAIAGGRVTASPDGAQIPEKLYVYADLFGPRGTEDTTQKDALFAALSALYPLSGGALDKRGADEARRRQEVDSLAAMPLTSNFYARMLTLRPGTSAGAAYVPGPTQGPYQINTPTLIGSILDKATRQLKDLRGRGMREEEFVRLVLRRLVDAQRPLSDVSAVVDPDFKGNFISGYRGEVFAASTIDTDGVEAAGLTGLPNSRISKIGDIELSATAIMFKPLAVPEVRAEGKGLKIEAIAAYRDGDRLRFEAASDDESAGSFGANVDGGAARRRTGR